MQTIKIQTTQNIELEYELAGIGDRIVAYLVDFVVYCAYGFCVLIVYQLAGTFRGSEYIFLLIILPVFLYQPLCEIFLNGQSLGKKMRQIRVISLDGNQPTISQYLVRWLFRIVDIMIGSGVIAVVTISLSSKAQRIGDMLAGTTVVRTRRPVRFSETIFTEAGDNYKPQFEQASQLNEADISLLKEVLLRFNRDPSGQAPVLIKAYDKIRKILGVYDDHDPQTFLETVVRDFNYLTGKVE